MNLFSCIVAAALVGTSVGSVTGSAGGSPTTPNSGAIDVRSVAAQEYPRVSAVVRVLDDHGQTAPSLSADDFDVTEDGRPVSGVQVRPNFANGGSVAVVLLIDTSLSMRGAPLQAAQEAAQEFVNRLGPDDKVALITFGRPPIEHGTFVPPRSLTDLGGLAASGYTALYDAINLGVARLASQPASARAVVVFTDGGDDGSSLSLAQLRPLVSDASIPVDVVGYTSAESNPSAMASVAAASGGSYRQTSNPADLSVLYGQIADSLLTQYLITYTSSAGPGHHTLRIATTGVAVHASATTTFQVAGAPPPRTKLPTRTGARSGGGNIPVAAPISVVAILLILGGVAYLRRRRGAGPSSAKPIPRGDGSPGTTTTSASGAPPAAARLVLEGAGVMIPVCDEPMLVGRDPTAQVIIDDPSVSRFHANLHVAPDGIWVEDLGSSNGTMINGVRVERELLRPGDALDIGDLHLVLTEPKKERLP
jgi:hypothetical protein